VIFIGIFVTMVPATLLLEEMGKSGADQDDPRVGSSSGAPGALSSFLDNAPTYVTFASLACGVVGGQAGQTIDPSNLSQLLPLPQGVLFLKAVSCGSVFMGANTYIGNGPELHGEGHRRGEPGQDAQLLRLHGLVDRGPDSSFRRRHSAVLQG
jgi:Na+/H+ antiporter NhaD/arsenite permease-like protein